MQRTRTIVRSSDRTVRIRVRFESSGSVLRVRVRVRVRVRFESSGSGSVSEFGFGHRVRARAHFRTDKMLNYSRFINKSNTLHIFLIEETTHAFTVVEVREIGNKI